MIHALFHLVAIAGSARAAVSILRGFLVTGGFLVDVGEVVERVDHRDLAYGARMSKHPVVISAKTFDAIGTDELAARIAAEQKATVGATFGYCHKCLLPVSKHIVKVATKAGRPPICSHCHRQQKKDDRNWPVYLCLVCRTPLTGKRLLEARHAAKRGSGSTCGDQECRRVTLERSKKKSVPNVACAVCGAECSSVTTNNYRQGKILAPHCEEHLIRQRFEPRRCCACGSLCNDARVRVAAFKGHRIYCADHRPGNDPKPLEPCFICGEPATRKSSEGKRNGRHKNACCEAHKGRRVKDL